MHLPNQKLLNEKLLNEKLLNQKIASRSILAAIAPALVCGLSVLIAGCGGEKQSPKSPKDVAQGEAAAGDSKDTTALALPVAPVRKASKEAKDDFKEAVEAYNSGRKAGSLSGDACKSVAEKFASVYKDHPKVPEAKFNEGVIWEECGNAAKAEQVYQDLVREHPNYGPALNNLGQIYFNKGNASLAMTQFQKATSQKNSEAYSNLAIIQRNQALNGQTGMVSEAINNVHRALAVDSFNIDAYGTKALVLYDHAKTHSQLEMARLICVQAIKQDPNYAPVYNTLGLILLHQGDVTGALSSFRKAVAAEPNFIEAHMNIGAITLSFRDYKSADESFSKVLSLNPSDKKIRYEATIGLGVAYRGQRKFTEAMQKYKEAEGMQPNNVDVAYNMGILVQDYMFDASDPAKAIADLERARNLLNRYLAGGTRRTTKEDCERRLKNINELIPMLREQQKMIKEGQGQKSG